ncbi:MAG TPA: restriction endonuclease subunit S, partial [Methanoregulaceae archaeon]|nr:restriction endonuclease subunit S [Methanoregulaceae archaeon]
MKKKDLPVGWEWKKLRDISVINSGYGFPIEFQEESHGDIPFFKVMDISKNFLKNEKYLDKSDFYISYENFKKINGSFFKKGTIVFAKIGAALLLNRRAILNCDSVVDNNIIGV